MMPPAVTPLHRSTNALADARTTCAYPPCRNAVVPPQRTCCDAHKAAANRMKGDATLELYAALHRLGVSVTTAQAHVIVAKVGLGVVSAFLEWCDVYWDSKAREWRVGI